MIRFLRSLIKKRSTLFHGDAAFPGEIEQGEERVALSAFATFDSDEFARRTGYTVRDEKHFMQAVVHRSYLQLCPPDQFQSNERMEFLGDSILNFVVAEYLYNFFPDAEEGELSKLRSRLVSRVALGECARKLELVDFLLLSPSAHQSISNGSESILVDAVEAFVAAIYLDGGFEPASRFVTDHLLNSYSADRMKRDENYKSRLLEYTQGRGMGTPRYVTVDETGPDHNPLFTVEVQVEGVPVGTGKGGNKKSAEQYAASCALLYFQKNDEQKSASK